MVTFGMLLVAVVSLGTTCQQLDEAKRERTAATEALARSTLAESVSVAAAREAELIAQNIAELETIISEQVKALVTIVALQGEIELRQDDRTLAAIDGINREGIRLLKTVFPNDEERREFLNSIRKDLPERKPMEPGQILVTKPAKKR